MANSRLILEELKPLLAEARKRGLWFWERYYDLWLSPDELESKQSEGEFRWGPNSWVLRDPAEYIERCANEVDEAQRTLDSARDRVAKAIG